MREQQDDSRWEAYLTVSRLGSRRYTTSRCAEYSVQQILSLTHWGLIGFSCLVVTGFYRDVWAEHVFYGKDGSYGGILA